MTIESPTPSKLLAFVSTTSFEGLGACGGMLIVNQLGRPVEFHCTSPVTTNRTQEILFGQALPNYIFCEQIARSMISELKQKPAVFLTNSQQLSELPSLVDVPVFFIGEFPWSTPMASTRHSFDLDGRKIQVVNFQNELDEIVEFAHNFHRNIPIDEPFERISQALDEAHAVAR